MRSLTAQFEDKLYRIGDNYKDAALCRAPQFTYQFTVCLPVRRARTNINALIWPLGSDIMRARITEKNFDDQPRFAIERPINTDHRLAVIDAYNNLATAVFENPTRVFIKTFGDDKSRLNSSIFTVKMYWQAFQDYLEFFHLHMIHSEQKLKNKRISHQAREKVALNKKNLRVLFLARKIKLPIKSWEILL